MLVDLVAEAKRWTVALPFYRGELLPGTSVTVPSAQKLQAGLASKKMQRNSFQH